MYWNIDHLEERLLKRKSGPGHFELFILSSVVQLRGDEKEMQDGIMEGWNTGRTRMKSGIMDNWSDGKDNRAMENQSGGYVIPYSFSFLFRVDRDMPRDLAVCVRLLESFSRECFI